MAKPFRKRGSKNYYAEIWTLGRRQTVSLGTDNYGVARSIVGQLEHDARTTGLARPTRTPLSTLAQQFADHVRVHQRAKSAQTDIYRLREFFGPICRALQGPVHIRNGKGPTPKRRPGRPKRAERGYAFATRAKYIEEVTTAQIIEFLSELTEKRGIGPKTWNEYRAVLHRFFAWAGAIQGVSFSRGPNPVAAVPRRRTESLPISFLTLQQVRAQLDALADTKQLQTMVAVLIYAGLRREELLWLTPDDVDTQRRIIHVRAKSVGGRFWKPKTGRDRRIPISSALLPQLNAYRPPHGGPWYFPAPRGGFWDPDNFGHALADENRKLGLSWTCLAYRHTFGTQLAMAGRDERTIAELMGNSPAIVRKHYAAWLPEAHPKAVEFDRPDGPQPMEDVYTANVRVEAERRGLRVVGD